MAEWGVIFGLPPFLLVINWLLREIGKVLVSLMLEVSYGNSR